MNTKKWTLYKAFLCLLAARAHLRAPRVFGIFYVSGAYYKLAFTCSWLIECQKGL